MFKQMVLCVVFVFITRTYAQSNRVIDEKSGKPMLIGIVNNESFIVDTAFSWWYNSEYANYHVDSATVQQITLPLDIQIRVVLGTWCSDSRREVPRFLKIADALHLSKSQLELIAVDRKKKAPNNATDSLSIELVPTFIVYGKTGELGRIIETPKESLEKDLLQIISQSKKD